MLDREQTIEKLASIRDMVREALADESADRQTALEAVERETTMIIGDLIPTGKDDFVAGVTLLLDLLIPTVPDSKGGCPNCGKCTDRCPVSVLDPQHGCKCN